MTDKLLKLLEAKLTILKEQKEQDEQHVAELKQLQNIIDTLEKNPFSLYELDDISANYIVGALSLKEDYFETIKKYKVIYEGYLQFGREAVPQIAIVEEFIRETNEKLNERKSTLSDEVAKHQYTIIQYDEYKELMEQVTDPEKAVSKINLLLEFLSQSTLETNEKNAILLGVNEKNNTVFEKQLLSDSPIDVENQSEYELMIESIKDRLELEFNPVTLNSLESISELLSSCRNQEDFESIIEGWKFSFGDESIVKIIDGLISLKNIEFLTLKAIAGEEIEDYIEESNAIDMQIGFLEEYKRSIEAANELENESTMVDTSVSKVEQALSEYVADPLATPNVVLFISDAVDRDIKAIDDAETLEDAFLLIEQLKTDTVESKRRLAVKGELDLIKPNSKGKQARVVFTRLSDNVYGVLHVSGKKADNPKGWITTLESRRKNCDVDSLKKKITEPEVLDYYVTKTKDISSRLKIKVSNLYSGKEDVVSGGTK